MSRDNFSWAIFDQLLQLQKDQFKPSINCVPQKSMTRFQKTICLEYFFWGEVIYKVAFNVVFDNH